MNGYPTIARLGAHKQTIAYAGLLFATITWGSTFFIIKNSVEHVQPVVLVAYRFLLAATLLGIVLAMRRQPLWAHWRTGLVLGITTWLIYIPQTIGLKYTSAANSGFITGLFVIFVPLFSLLFFKTKPTVNKVMASVISTQIFLITMPIILSVVGLVTWLIFKRSLGLIVSVLGTVSGLLILLFINLGS